MSSHDNITLGGLIAWLEAQPPDRVYTLGWGGGDGHSYRGFYSELAFEPQRNALVKDMLREAQACVGVTFEGYKGGDYEMDESSHVWISSYGTTSDSIELTKTLLGAWLEMAELREALLADRSSPQPTLTVAMKPDLSKLSYEELFAELQRRMAEVPDVPDTPIQDAAAEVSAPPVVEVGWEVSPEAVLLSDPAETCDYATCTDHALFGFRTVNVCPHHLKTLQDVSCAIPGCLHIHTGNVQSNGKRYCFKHESLLSVHIRPRVPFPGGRPVF